MAGCAVTARAGAAGCCAHLRLAVPAMPPVQEVEGLGASGRQTKVNHGYARNYLIPKRLAAVQPMQRQGGGGAAAAAGAAQAAAASKLAKVCELAFSAAAASHFSVGCNWASQVPACQQAESNAGLSQHTESLARPYCCTGPPAGSKALLSCFQILVLGTPAAWRSCLGCLLTPGGSCGRTEPLTGGACCWGLGGTKKILLWRP